MLDGAADVFSSTKRKVSKEELDAQTQQLHAKIGKQAVEIDFLVKKSKQLGL